MRQTIWLAKQLTLAAAFCAMLLCKLCKMPAETISRALLKLLCFFPGSATVLSGCLPCQEPHTQYASVGCIGRLYINFYIARTTYRKQDSARHCLHEAKCLSLQEAVLLLDIENIESSLECRICNSIS